MQSRVVIGRRSVLRGQTGGDSLKISIFSPTPFVNGSIGSFVVFLAAKQQLYFLET